MMFGVGIVVSELTARMRRQEREALSRETAHRGALRAHPRPRAADRPNQDRPRSRRVTRPKFSPRGPSCSGISGRRALARRRCPRRLSLRRKRARRREVGHRARQPAGLGTDTLPGSQSLCAPLRVRALLARRVLALIPPREGRATNRCSATSWTCFAARSPFALRASAAGGRSAAVRAARQDRRDAQSSLLSAVSHDLRTPLAAITGAATALRDDPGLDARRTASCVDAICDEAERLERLVANLLDMTRLESGAVAAQKGLGSVEEIVGSALTRLDARLETRKVTDRHRARLPLVLVDPVLFEQVSRQPLRQRRQVHAGSQPHRDQAPVATGRGRGRHSRPRAGSPPGNEKHVFEKFFRGPPARYRGRRARLADLQGDRRSARRERSRSRKSPRGPSFASRFLAAAPLLLFTGARRGA